MCVCVCVYIYILCVWMCLCVCVCVCIYIYTHTMCVCVYIYLYIHIYIYLCIHNGEFSSKNLKTVMLSLYISKLGPWSLMYLSRYSDHTRALCWQSRRICHKDWLVSGDSRSVVRKKYFFCVCPRSEEERNTLGKETNFLGATWCTRGELSLLHSDLLENEANFSQYFRVRCRNL